MKTTTIKAFIEQSFLAPLLSQIDITDISFNGDQLFYQSSRWGRKLYDKTIEEKEVFDFVVQLANLSEQHFSLARPVLDVAIEGYRMHALGPTVSRYGFQKVTSFSLRISRTKEMAISYPKVCMELIQSKISKRSSLLIFGETGSGKTELQKGCLALLPPHSRLIVIDNVLELDGLTIQKDLDMNVWQANTITPVSLLIESALRSNPDWIILAEARGKEMLDVMNAALTGHPIITTLHAHHISTLFPRITRMMMLNGPQIQYQNTLDDVEKTFPFAVQVAKKYASDGSIERYIKGIFEFMDHHWKALYE